MNECTIDVINNVIAKHYNHIIHFIYIDNDYICYYYLDEDRIFIESMRRNERYEWKLCDVGGDVIR